MDYEDYNNVDDYGDNDYDGDGDDDNDDDIISHIICHMLYHIITHSACIISYNKYHIVYDTVYSIPRNMTFQG